MPAYRFVVLTAFFVFASLVRADVLDDIAVITLSPADGKAVIKSKSHAPVVVGAGEALFGSQYVVSQVLTERLLVNDSTKPGIPGLIWIHQAKGNAPSRVQRVQELSSQEPVFTPISHN